MAIVNPTPTDFIANQERALDYQQYRSTSDVLRAMSEFYKISVFKETSRTELNYITTGLTTSASVNDTTIEFTITQGGGVFDNQSLYFTNDFVFDIDKPSADTNYYVYLFYKYVEEYPANYAFISISDTEITDDGYYLIATAFYSSTDDTITVDLNPRELLISENAGCDNGVMYPIIVSADAEAQPNNVYYVDTSSGPVTMTLTDAPENHDTIAFYDMKGTFDDNPLTVVAPEGYTVHGEFSKVFINEYTYAVVQILDPSTDKNWYLKLESAETYDSGEY